jgi:hypothetical protein
MIFEDLGPGFAGHMPSLKNIFTVFAWYAGILVFWYDVVLATRGGSGGTPANPYVKITFFF